MSITPLQAFNYVPKIFPRVPRGPGLVNDPRCNFPVRSPIATVSGSFNLIAFHLFYFFLIFLVFSYHVFHHFMSPHYPLSVVPDILTVRTKISHRNSRMYGLPMVRVLHSLPLWKL